jgi:DNA-binding SARP family transcriptional activator/TolB-like protein
MFTLRVFGGAVLDGPENRVKGAAAQRRRVALLVILSRARGRPLGREKLIGLLWPENTTESARHLLAQALYAVRKAVPQEPFITAGDEVGLDEHVITSDANSFEDSIAAGDLARAVEIYRGDFLDGFFLPDAVEFERWVEEERARLKRAQGQALEQLAETAEQGEDPLTAAEWWLRASEHEPYSSRLVLRRMRALEWGGEHLAALRAAERHAEFLREDIGAAPDPEVLAYAERLRTSPAPGRVPPVPPTRRVLSNDQFAGLPGVAASGGSDETGMVELLPVTARLVEERVEDPRVDVKRARADSYAVDAEDRDGDGVILSPSVSRRRQRLRIMSLTLLALLIIGLIATFGSARDFRPAPSGSGRLDPRRIAVLYFDDLSENHDGSHIAAGLTETLTHELAQVHSLDVISRNGVKPFRGREVPVDSIASTLRAGSLVEGSVQRSDGRVKVTVQLIDGSTGSHLQSRTLVRPIGELFELEEDLGKEVSRFLRERLGEEIRIRERLAGTRNPAARELMMKAEELRRRTERAAGEPDPLGPAATVRLLVRADSLLATAEREDPDWLEAKMARGWVALDLARALAEQEQGVNFSRAILFAERVLGRAPADPAALELRGSARWGLARLDGVRSAPGTRTLLESAENDLKTALERDPSRATAWSTLSQYLRLQGRLPEADVAARRALETDEFLGDSDLILERLYRSALLVGRYDEGWKWCAEGRQRFPANWRFAECELTLLGYGQGTSGDVARAWSLRRELDQLDPPAQARESGRPYSPVFRDINVAHVLARARMNDSARAVIARAQERAGGDSTLLISLAYDEARVRYALGDTTQTLRLLSFYLEHKQRLRAYVAQDITFSGLRNHPLFQRITQAPAAARNE